MRCGMKLHNRYVFNLALVGGALAGFLAISGCGSGDKPATVAQVSTVGPAAPIPAAPGMACLSSPLSMVQPGSIPMDEEEVIDGRHGSYRLASAAALLS